MIHFLLSPTALHYVPVLLLHLVSLGYLLIQHPKTRQTWLFCGWLGGMTLMVTTQCAARSATLPQMSAYLDWWGGIVGVTLAMVALLQFAYHYPRLRYPREARIVLVVSLLVTAGLFAWTAWETFSALGHHLHATSTVRPDVAFDTRSVWILYDFESFRYGFAGQRDAGIWVSYKFFDYWQIIGNLWVLIVWLRKTIQTTTSPHPRGHLHAAWTALTHPEGKEARISRGAALLMLLAPLPVLTSTLESLNILAPGTFATVHLLTLATIMLTYVNYALKPTSFMARLVGISLVTLLIILELISDYTMQAHRQAYIEMRRTEVDHARNLAAQGNLDVVSADILYIAARPIAGLFATDYQILTARSGAPDSAQLIAHDKLLRQGLSRGHHPSYFAVLLESPWLQPGDLKTMTSEPNTIDERAIPTEATTYRGSASKPSEQTMRYSFVLGDTRYEIGYSYQDYRRYLHHAALPLVAMMAGTTTLILTLFPHFFRLSLITPLTHLLAGVDRVNRGELDVRVPVRLEDEIGELTHAFNRMVDSLAGSEEQLKSLNTTLEQRVADRTRDLATLYQIAALINQATSLDALLADALACVVPAVDAAAGLVLLTGDACDPLTVAATYGTVLSTAPEIISIPLWAEAFRQGEAILIHDVTSDSGTLQHLKTDRAMQPQWPYRTVVGVPIPGQETCLGVLGLFSEAPFTFNVEDLELLETVSEQLGVAIEKTRLRERAAATIVLEERQRLARDLHDSVTQLIYSQTLFAKAATKALDAGQTERTGHYLTRLGEAAGRALREMRLMIYRLRPAELSEVGLIGALQRRVEIVEQRAGIRATIVDEASHPFPATLEQACYHIAEEALNNALKHAGATEVNVKLWQEDQTLGLSVIDNGRGFDAHHISPGLGLQSLQERANGLGGALTIETAPGQGTHIVVRLPLETYTGDTP